MFKRHPNFVLDKEPMIGESHQVYTVSYAAAVVKKTAKKV